MLAGQLEQVSVVARLLASQRLLGAHILAGVALILQVCLSGGFERWGSGEVFDVEKREKVPGAVIPKCSRQ